MSSFRKRDDSIEIGTWIVSTKRTLPSSIDGIQHPLVLGCFRATSFFPFQSEAFLLFWTNWYLFQGFRHTSRLPHHSQRILLAHPPAASSSPQSAHVERHPQHRRPIPTRMKGHQSISYTYITPLTISVALLKSPNTREGRHNTIFHQSVSHTATTPSHMSPKLASIAPTTF